MISPPTRTSSRSTSSSDDAEFEDAVDFIQPSPDPNSSEISATGGKGPSIALKVRNDGLAEQPPDLLLVTDNGLEGALADLGLDDVELDLPPPKVAEQLLSSDLKELKACVKMFLNSRFLEAEKILRSKYKKSLYCKFEGIVDTHGYAVLRTIKAIMTFDPKDISYALALLRTAVECAHVYRKKDGSIIGNLAQFVKGASLDAMTLLQRHAELIYAEAYLLKALITILNDESFVSFIREGINIRSSYMTYKQCYKWLSKSGKTAKSPKIRTPILRRRRSKSSESPVDVVELRSGVDADFLSGVRLGIGVFNVLLSTLPPRVLKIFEIIGFSGSREFGLEQLSDADAATGLRAFLCNLSLLSYHTVVGAIIAYANPDLEYAQTLIDRELEIHPQGAFFLFFKARLSFCKSRSSDAISWYRKSIESQNEWTQLHHVCRWDMSFCYNLQLKFWDAAQEMRLLKRDSKWSKAGYTYILASQLLMARELGQKEVDKKEIDDLLAQRIAGKRIPFEKFIARKARKYSTQNDRLLLPVFELMIFWNGFAYMGTHLSAALELVESRMKALEALDQGTKGPTAPGIPSTRYDLLYDDLCLCYLLRGIILREMQLFTDSRDSFKLVLKTEKKIHLDHYIAPFTRFEIGRLCLAMIPPEVSEARQLFESARKDYKKFSMENSLHFKVHNALRRVEEMETGKVSKDGMSRESFSGSENELGGL